MIRPLNFQEDDVEDTWIKTYYSDFKKRLLNLLGYEFRAMTCNLAFQFIGQKNMHQGQTDVQEDQAIIDTIDKTKLEEHISVYDLKRLDSYAKNMVDFHLIMDLVPTIAKLFFLKQVLPKGSVNLSYAQSAILIGMGLQFKKVEQLEKDLQLNSSQILPLFNKMMRKFNKVIKSVFEREIAKEIDQHKQQSKNLILKHTEEDNDQGDVKFVTDLQDEKLEFIKEKLKNKDKIPSVITVQGKRGSEVNTAQLEQEHGGKKSGKKAAKK